MTEKAHVAPRISHNSNLSAWFIEQHKVTSRYPRVTEQIECLPLEKAKLQPHAYNSSIAEYAGKLYLAYRWHDGKTLHSSLGLAEIDKKGVVHHNSRVELGAGGEDPKLFVHDGKLHISWVETTFPKVPVRAFVQYGHFKGEPALVKGMTRPEVPGNDTTTLQKNHVPFSQDGLLYWLYQTSPVQTVYRLKGSIADQRFETRGPKWAYGQPRGGTSPVPFEGNLLRFFHSGLDNEFGTYNRRYFLGAYIMRETPPFEVLAVSEKPIVYGSEIDNLKVSGRPHHWKANVVFPGGVVVEDGGWLVAVGVNDHACEILRIKPQDLHLI